MTLNLNFYRFRWRLSVRKYAATYGALFLFALANTGFSASPPESPLRVALKAGDLARVEALAQELEKDYIAGALTGDEYTDRLMDVLPDKARRDWEGYLQKWRTSRPNSYIASFTLGIFYENVSRQLRGGKYAADMTAEQLAEEREYDNKAQVELESSLRLSNKPYPTYCVLIQTATSDRRKKGAYFRSALQVDPYSLRAWHQYLSLIRPRWGGSTEQMKSLVAEALKSPLRESEKKHLVAIEYTLQAEDAAELKRYQEAVFLYRAAYQELPDKKNLWRLNKAGEVAKNAEFVDLALTIYGQVLDIDPENADALNARGQVYEFKKENLTLAFADYKRSADLGNNWAQKIVGRWLLLGKGVAKDSAKAQIYLDKAEGRCAPPLVCPSSYTKRD